MYICKYCAKEFLKPNQIGSHVRKCRLNPKFEKNNKKNMKSLSKNNEKRRIEKYGEIINKKVTCSECSKEFIYLEREFIKKEKYFCSKHCIAVHNGKTFHLTKEQYSQINKDAYKNGKKVGGGRTKWYTVLTSNGEIRVQGTYELRTVKILDIMKRNNVIKNWKCHSDRVQYVGLDNKQHTYIIDFRIINNDDTFYYLEVKGYEKEVDKLKWAAVREEKIRIDVWFLKEIEENERIYCLVL